ncbi:hypothetical protein Tco_0005995 [Tanacetum coccineum]
MLRDSHNLLSLDLRLLACDLSLSLQLDSSLLSEEHMCGGDGSKFLDSIDSSECRPSAESDYATHLGVGGTTYEATLSLRAGNYVDTFSGGSRRSETQMLGGGHARGEEMDERCDTSSTLSSLRRYDLFETLQRSSVWFESRNSETHLSSADVALYMAYFLELLLRHKGVFSFILVVVLVELWDVITQRACEGVRSLFSSHGVYLDDSRVEESGGSCVLLLDGDGSSCVVEWMGWGCNTERERSYSGIETRSLQSDQLKLMVRWVMGGRLVALETRRTSSFSGAGCEDDLGAEHTRTQVDYDLSLPPEVYALVSNHRIAKELWERIQLLMQGTSLTKQEIECKLYDEFDKFAYKKREMLRDFYLRFSLLLNDINIYNVKLEQFQVNTKFLNTLPPE